MDSPKILISCTAISLSIIAGLYYYRKKNKFAKPPKKWIPIGKVSELLIYPLKSGYRNKVDEAECTEFGFKQVTDKDVYKLQDRFLVTYKDSDNEFRTARTHPKLVMVKVSNHDAEHVALDAPDMKTLYVKIPQITDKTEFKTLTFRKEYIQMIDCGNEAATWLSHFVLEKESGLRLGFHDDNLKCRIMNDNTLNKYYPQLTENDMGIFSDLSAFLLINQSSVDDLNTKIASDKIVTAYQFRPNIIIENTVAYAEDKWKWVKIGDEALFYCVKPCTRCIFTTMDTETGERSKEREPLNTLEKYRMLKDPEERKAFHDSPLMGVNMGLRKAGIIKTGDIIYVGVY